MNDESDLRTAKELVALVRGDKGLSPCRVSIAVPGYPHDGRDPFYQKDARGPHMVVLDYQGMRCHLWRTREGKYAVRQWAVIGDKALVTAFVSIEEALDLLLKTVPKEARKDDFENLRKDFLHGDSGSARQD